MRRPFSTELLNDILNTVRMAASAGNVIDISSLAEQVRLRHETENIALEDIIQAMMQQAQWLNVSIEFSGEYARSSRPISIHLD